MQHNNPIQVIRDSLIFCSIVSGMFLPTGDDTRVARKLIESILKIDPEVEFADMIKELAQLKAGQATQGESADKSKQGACEREDDGILAYYEKQMKPVRPAKVARKRKVK